MKCKNTGCGKSNISKKGFWEVVFVYHSKNYDDLFPNRINFTLCDACKAEVESGNVTKWVGKENWLELGRENKFIKNKKTGERYKASKENCDFIFIKMHPPRNFDNRLLGELNRLAWKKRK